MNREKIKKILQCDFADNTESSAEYFFLIRLLYYKGWHPDKLIAGEGSFVGWNLDEMTKAITPYIRTQQLAFLKKLGAEGVITRMSIPGGICYCFTKEFILLLQEELKNLN